MIEPKKKKTEAEPEVIANIRRFKADYEVDHGHPGEVVFVNERDLSTIRKWKEQVTGERVGIDRDEVLEVLDLQVAVFHSEFRSWATIARFATRGPRDGEGIQL